jgi:Flp pilus assembly pilin Flp
MTMRARIAGPFRRFRRSEDGTVTVEFALILPIMFAIFLATFELGMLLTRQVMLDRGVDLAVRAVRLGALDPALFPTPAAMHDALKRGICQGAVMIPDCENNIRLEMRALNPRGLVNIPLGADCIDRADPGRPLRDFQAGFSNQLMILRACTLYDPYMPTSGLGAALIDNQTGAFAMVSMSSFVIEPN